MKIRKDSPLKFNELFHEVNYTVVSTLIRVLYFLLTHADCLETLALFQVMTPRNY
jgi:predicted secreted protein